MDHQEPTDQDNYNILSSFASIMQQKRFNKKLTKGDLEEICHQKISEVILHATEIGETYFAYKKQEEALKNLQKDLIRLLDEVENLKSINAILIDKLESADCRCYRPVKLKRSVALQVNLD